MISFKSKSQLIAYNGVYPSQEFFDEPLPPHRIRFRSWSKNFVLSPDLEAYARGETNELDPKYRLGWILLALIARKMYEAGTLEPRPTYKRPQVEEDMFARVHREVRETYVPPKPGFWRRIFIRLGILNY